MDQLGDKLVNSGSPFKFLNTRDSSFGQLPLRLKSGRLLLLGYIFSSSQFRSFHFGG